MPGPDVERDKFNLKTNATSAQTDAPEKSPGLMARWGIVLGGTVIVLAVYAVRAVGGMTALKAGVAGVIRLGDPPELDHGVGVGCVGGSRGRRHSTGGSLAREALGERSATNGLVATDIAVR